MKTKVFALALGAAVLVVQPLRGATQPAASMPTRDPATFSHQALAYVENQLDDEISLPNGKKIEPNGTIVGIDGSIRPMLPSQTFTLDGRVISAPLLDLPSMQPMMPTSTESPSRGQANRPMR